MTEQHEKLDAYCPPLEAVAGVRQQLLNAGVPPEIFPERWFPEIIAAMAKWMQTTEDGLKFGARLFHFDFQRGMDTHQYEVTHYEKCQGRDFCMNRGHCMPNGVAQPVRCLRELQPIVKEVNSTDIYFFKGCISERQPIPLSAVAFYEKPKGQCEGCGITSHCLRPVSGAYSGTTTDQCNHCVSYSDSPRVRSEGDPSICDSCTDLRCTHHPRRGHP